MEWKFKLLKLSTYNSLENQLKLKDTIISQTNESKQTSIAGFELIIKKQRERIENNFRINESLQAQIKTLEEMNELLQTQNTNQSNTIFQIHNERAELIRSFENLKNKYQRKYQPRIGGKFAKKNKCNEDL